MSVASLPSLLEVYAAQQLNSALRPALRFALDVLAVRHAWLRRLANWSDEVFTALILLIEGAQLRTHSALFSETLYSLHRIPTSFSSSRSAPPRQSRARVTLGLVLGVLLPYARARLDDWHSRSTRGAAAALFDDEPSMGIQTGSSSSTMATARGFVLRIWPRVTAIVDTTALLCSLAYLHGLTRFASPALMIQRMELRRASTVSVGRTAKVLSVVRAGLVVAVLGFQFLQYYYASEAAAPRDSGPTVAPPEALEPAAGVDREVALARGMCPLCRRVRENPTACMSSGYVFCYLCILSHVQRMQKCPVTMAPATVNDLVRVFEE